MSKISVKSSIARRLGFGFSCVLAMLVAVAGTSGWAMHNMSTQLKQIAEVNNLKSKLANDLMGTISELSIQARDIILSTDLGLTEVQAKKFSDMQKSYVSAEEALAATFTQYAATDEEWSLLKSVMASSKPTLLQFNDAALLGYDGDNVGAVLALNKAKPAEAAWRKQVTQLIALQDTLSGQANALAIQSQRHALVITVVLVAVSVMLGILIALRITRSVTAPIKRAMVVTERIATGDLTSHIEVRIHDETGRLLEAISTMQERLRGLVGDILRSADSIQAASTEVVSGNNDLNKRTEQASGNLQHATSSMEDLTAMVKASADHARHANQMAGSAAEVAARGGAVVSQVVATMEDINASSKKIADIISVIDGIAFQTNILALNAAVEAARAGEQGRGFAVVAGEVRSLAGRCAGAAKEIKALINTSVERVDDGTRLVAAAGKTMTEIVGSVKIVSDIISEISTASTKQSNGIVEINQSMCQLDHMTLQNATLVEQSATAAESLQGQAVSLTHMVGTFKLTRTADPA